MFGCFSVMVFMFVQPKHHNTQRLSVPFSDEDDEVGHGWLAAALAERLGDLPPVMLAVQHQVREQVGDGSVIDDAPAVAIADAAALSREEILQAAHGPIPMQQTS